MLGRSVIKSIGAGLTTAALVPGIQMIKVEAAVERSCAPRQVVADGLIKKFQGKRQAADLVSGKAVMDMRKALQRPLCANRRGWSASISFPT